MSQIKILIAEDDSIIALDLKSTLEKLGYKVSGVLSSGEEVLEKLQSLETDLILIDIKLKGEMDGIKTVYFVKQAFDIPIVYITTYEDKLSLKRAQLTKPSGYLLRTFKEDELNGVIEIALSNHKNEKKLKENEHALQNYKDIVNYSPVGIFQSDINGNFITVNPTLIRMLNYNTVDEFFNIDIPNKLYLNPREREEEIWSFLKKGEDRNIEIKWRKKDGTPIWIQLNVKTIKDKAGKILYYLGFVTDIDKKKKTEDELKKQEESYKTLIDSSKDAIYVLQNEKLVLVNPAWERLFGYSLAEVSEPSFKLINIISPEHHVLYTERMNKRKKEEFIPSTYELCGLTKSGDKIELEVSVSDIQWKGKPALQGIYRNITERKNSEKALKDSEVRFRQLAENIRDIFFVTELDNKKGFYISLVV